MRQLKNYLRRKKIYQLLNDYEFVKDSFVFKNVPLVRDRSINMTGSSVCIWLEYKKDHKSKFTWCVKDYKFCLLFSTPLFYQI